MGDSSVHFEQAAGGLKIRVSPQRGDQLRLIVSLLLMYGALSPPSAVAFFFAYLLGGPFVVGVKLILSAAWISYTLYVALLLIRLGRETVIDLQQKTLAITSPQLLTGKKVFARSGVRSVYVKRLVGPLATLEIRYKFDDPVRVLLAHKESDLREIAERLGAELGHQPAHVFPPENQSNLP